MLFILLARYDQQLQLGQAFSGCMKTGDRTIPRVSCCCSFTVHLRAFCIIKMNFLFLVKDGSYFLNWDASGPSCSHVYLNVILISLTLLNYASRKEIAGI